MVELNIFWTISQSIFLSMDSLYDVTRTPGISPEVSSTCWVLLERIIKPHQQLATTV